MGYINMDIRGKINKYIGNITPDTKEFNTNFQRWFEECKNLKYQEQKKAYKNNYDDWGRELSFDKYKNYIRVFSKDINGENPSAWAFVDRSTGDVYGAKKWGVPEKTPVTNISDRNSASYYFKWNK